MNYQSSISKTFSVKEKQSEVIERVIDTVDEVMYNEADKLIFQ